MENIVRDAFQNETFSEGFADRVMQNLDRNEEARIVRHDFRTSVYQSFRNIAVSGVAAILIFLIGVWAIDGELSFDSIAGTQDLNQQNVTTFLVYDY